MDKKQLADLKKTHTPEQIAVIKYFDPLPSPIIKFVVIGFIAGAILGTILGSAIRKDAGEIIGLILGIAGAVGGFYLNKKMSIGGMSDADYDAFVQSQISKLKEKALSTLGVDEDQVKEIEPAHFGGYKFDSRSKKQANGKYVSSHWKDAWLFFSDTQIYIYVYDFHLDKDSKNENTQEFFYKDVTSLSTTTESSKTKVLVPVGCMKPPELKEQSLDVTEFRLIVPGDNITVPMENTNENTNKVQAMKQKLREKKS